ncbi:hypothetical protein CR513_48478, partial [Mucuna pruriens]
MRYLQGTKGYMLSYKNYDKLQVTGYSYSDFASNLNDRKSTSSFIFMMAQETIFGISQDHLKYIATILLLCISLKYYRSSSHTKHFDVKYLFVRGKIMNSQTRIEHLTTKNMLIDPLTKPLIVGAFHKHVVYMGLVKTFDIMN